MRIRIIVTGGTFDKDYDELEGKLTLKKTHLREIIKEIRCTVPIILEEKLLVDSLNMKKRDRLNILDSCKKSRERHIVITHGTDTMIDTAAVLGKEELGKTVILTGAMVPYTIKHTDALFNFGSALIAAQVLQPGVYIVMNGKTFDWDNVQKDYQKGIFTTRS